MKKLPVLLLAALLCAFFMLSANAENSTGWYEITAGSSPFLYSDSLLTDSPNGQDGDLVKICAAISAAAYSRSTVISVLNQMGFGNVVSDYTEYSFYDPHHAGYAIGQKKTGEYTIYCIAVRGTYAAYEWLSNAVTETENGYHRGYYLAESDLKADLDRLIAADGSGADKRIILLTGHSRGAAVADILAGQLAAAGTGRVYCYTFACPALYYGSASASGNIYNYVFGNDPIPRAMPKAWGYTCYGQNIVISAAGGDVLTTDETDEIVSMLSDADGDSDIRSFLSCLLNWGMAGGNEADFDAFMGAMPGIAGFADVLRNGMPTAELLARYECMLDFRDAHAEEISALSADGWDDYRDSEAYREVFTLYDEFAGSRITDAGMFFDTGSRISERYAAAVAVDSVAGLINYFFDVQPGCVPALRPAVDKTRNAHGVAGYLNRMNRTYYGYEGCKGKNLDNAELRINVQTVSPYCFSNTTGNFTVNTGNVKVIGAYAFAGSNGLKGVVIGDSTEVISEHAFDQCGHLSAVTIGENVTDIGDFAFKGCTAVSRITIPDSVKRIGTGVLQGCTGLEDISVPFVGSNRAANGSEDAVFGWIFGMSDSFTSEYQKYADGAGAYYEISQTIDHVKITDAARIPYGAFYGCHIRSIDLCDTVENIGDYAFYYAYPQESSLERIGMPGNLAVLGAYAFCNQAKLTGITLPSSLESIREETFDGCGLTDITIGSLEAWLNCSYADDGSHPNNGTNGARLYLDGTELTEIVIPDGVTAIGRCAFSNCVGIESVVTGNSVTGIGESAFENCSAIADITIGKNVRTIGGYAFANCKAVSAITIPDGVERIENGALQGCTALTDLSVPFVGSNREASGTQDAVFGWIFGTSDSFTAEYQRYADGRGAYYEIAQYVDRVKVTDTKQIPYGAFYGCHIGTVDLCDATESIGDYAFYNCDTLTECSVAPSVTFIGENAFPKNIMIQCYRYTFADSWAQANGNGIRYAGSGCVLTLPAGVTRIDDEAFSGIDAEQVIIPDGTIRIGSGAFSKCEHPVAVILPDSVEEIAENAFEDCANVVFVCSETSYAYQYAQKKGIYVYLITEQ